MSKNTRFVGMDVHAETIAVAVAEGRDQARSLGTILEYVMWPDPRVWCEAAPDE